MISRRELIQALGVLLSGASVSLATTPKPQKQYRYEEYEIDDSYWDILANHLPMFRHNTKWSIQPKILEVGLNSKGKLVHISDKDCRQKMPWQLESITCTSISTINGTLSSIDAATISTIGTVKIES